MGRISDREVDFVLGRDAGFESHAVRLRDHAADAILGEVQALLFRERSLEVASLGA
jgi:hypothetical protein